jgi:hypothetical protein
MKLIDGVLDYNNPDELRVDGISGIYRVSEHTLCVEMYANRIVDGKIEKVVVARNTWDRASWLATQQVIARIFAGVAKEPLAEMSDRDDEVRVH